MSTLPSYVLITPARNEAKFIELTLKSVVAQTVPPLKWVIVSDGSTDGTDDIVHKYVARYPWIELVRMRERSAERNRPAERIADEHARQEAGRELDEGERLGRKRIVAPPRQVGRDHVMLALERRDLPLPEP